MTATALANTPTDQVFTDPRSEHLRLALEPSVKLEKVKAEQFAGAVGDVVILDKSWTPFVRADGTPIPTSDWGKPGQGVVGSDLRPLLEKLKQTSVPLDPITVRPDGNGEFEGVIGEMAGTKFSEALSEAGIPENFQNRLLQLLIGKLNPDDRLCGGKKWRELILKPDVVNTRLLEACQGSIPAHLAYPNLFDKDPYFDRSLPARLEGSLDGQYLLCHGLMKGVFKVRGDDGAPLPIAAWTKVWEGAKIPSDQTTIRNTPALAPFRDSRGALIAGTSTYLRFDSGKVFFSDSRGEPRLSLDAKQVILDPHSQGLVLVLTPMGSLEEVDVSLLEKGVSPITQKRQLQPTTTSVQLTPDGKHLFVAHSEELSSKSQTIDIVERSSDGVAATIAAVAGQTQATADGSLLIRTDSQLRRVASNLVELSQTRLDTLRLLEGNHVRSLVTELSKENISTPEPSPAPLSAASHTKQEIQKGTESVTEMFKEAILGCSTPEQIAALRARLRELEQRPKNRGFPQLFDGARHLLDQREAEIGVNSLFTEIDAATAAVGRISSSIELTKLGAQIRALEEQRSTIRVADLNQRGDLSRALIELRQQAALKRAEFLGDSAQRLERAFDEISAAVRSAASPIELDDVKNTPTYREFTDVLSLMEDASQTEHERQRLERLFGARTLEFQEATRLRQDEEARTVAAIRSRSYELLNDIKMGLSACGSLAELGRWRRETRLLRELEELTSAAPEAVRATVRNDLGNIMRQRENALDALERSTVTRHGEHMVSFGGKQFAVFPPQSLHFEPKVISQVPGERVGRLVFEVGPGFQFDTGEVGISVDLSDDRVRELIVRYRPDAERYFNGVRTQPQPFNPNWIITPYVTRKLREFAENLDLVSRLGKGMVVVESDAGAGKNVLSEMLSHFLNRRYFEFSFHGKADPDDLRYTFEYDPSRGTYRVPSLLPEALQTPGALVVLDELNAAPDAVMQLLHPATDHRRRFPLSSRESIRIEPSVVLVSLVNPLSHAGTRKFTDALLSRSVLMNYQYPPEIEDGRKTGYEAEIYSRFISCLRDLRQHEFYAAWNTAVNKTKGNGGAMALTPEREAALHALDKVVRVANGVREAYTTTQLGTAKERIDFKFSLREGEFIAALLDQGIDVASALERMLLPKLGDVRQRQRVRDLIRREV